ncbi:MAG: molybdopterin cofactor-binding domain-containing protein [Thermoanaerobaculia bacterium]
MSTRRDFLVGSAVAGGGLLLGLRLPVNAAERGSPESNAPASSFRPNAWLRIAAGGGIVLVVGRSEMGQGVRTALAKIVAEELDVDLAQVELEQASPSAEYDDLGTGGSSSMSDGWMPLRQAGAAARAMLLGAAARRWEVSVDACRTAAGRVHGPGDRSASYGELAAEAAHARVPFSPVLKSAAQRKTIGQPSPRFDGPAIVTGRALYGLDVRRPGMLFAVVARPPRFGGSLRSFDAARALAFPGVRACFAIPSGVAVIAESTWSAISGRDQLAIEWTEGTGPSFESAAHHARLASAVEESGVTTRKDGRGRAALAAAALRHHAVYAYPFAAHGAVEPVNSTAHVTGERSGRKCEIWAATQAPNTVQTKCAEALGLKPSAVTVHVTLIGGGFGRRLGVDFNVESVEIARQVAEPVQLLWTRDDDLAHGYFQAAAAHRLEAACDGSGRILAWDHRKASTPHNARSKPSAAELADAEYLADSSWGVTDNPYLVADFESSYRVVDSPVPIGPWRAVFAPSSVFARESFIDELAAFGHRAPVDFRRELLAEPEGVSSRANGVRAAVPATPDELRRRGRRERLSGALERLATVTGWWREGTAALPPDHGRGVAADVFHTGTCVAYGVEVQRAAPLRPGDLPFGIARVVAVVDCGVVIDPDGVAQQVESGIFWSLSNAFGESTFENGRLRETNLETFRVARYRHLPEAIEIHIVDTAEERPRGLGEPVVSPFAPALANALAQLFGRRFRRLPLRPEDFA